jgi:hypothetical protein
MNPFIQQLFNAARNTAGRAVTGYGVQTRRNMGPQVRRALGDGALNPFAHPIVSAAQRDPSRLTAAAKATLAMPGAKPALVYIGGAAGVSAANKTGLTGAIEGGLNQIGPGLDRFFGAVIPKSVQDFGKSMEQYGWGALGGLVPGEAGSAPVSRPLNAIDYGKYGPTDWNPSANPSRGPADRAYQSAKAETAAMVATDPLMQQWSAAQKAKDFTTADQLGEQIWQNRYGKTEMGRPGGAIGSRNPLMDSTFGYQTGMSPGDIAKTITNPSDIPVSPGEAPYQTGDFGTRLGENGYDATKYGITPEMIEEMKKRLLQQSAK